MEQPHLNSHRLALASCVEEEFNWMKLVTVSGASSVRRLHDAQI